MLVNTRLWVGFLFVMAVFSLPSDVNAQIPGSFSTTWDTSLPGSSANNQVSISYGLPQQLEPIEDLEVYWEDTANSAINGTTTISTISNTITFPAPGIYRIDKPDFFLRSPFYADDAGDGSKLLTVEQWGDDAPSTFSGMFFLATNLTSVPSVEAPDMSLATEADAMFVGAASFNSAINHWNVSSIVNMQSMFQQATSFNQPLNNWNVSNVTFMDSMFQQATSFNQPLNDWGVSSVIHMTSMFQQATSFNQPLNDWNVSSVVSMEYMFNGATAFDQSLGTFDLSSEPSMEEVLGEVGLSIANYSDTLTGWANASIVPSGIFLGRVSDADSELIPYFSTTQSDRDILTADNSWTITDGGPIDAFELVYGSTVNASLTGNAIQTVASGKPGTPVTVVPNEGFEFIQWSDGNTDNPRTDTPTTASVSVIAQVAPIAQSSGGSSGTRVGQRQSDFIDVEPTKESTDRTVITSEGIAILNLSPEELENLPDDQKQQVIDILLSLIAILTEILTQMMTGE